MADGKQWYNNPNEPAKRNASGNPARPVNKSGKPVSGSAANRPLNRPAGQSGKPQAKPYGKNQQALRNGTKRPMGKPADKNIRVQHGQKPQQVRRGQVTAPASGNSIIPKVDINGKPTASASNVQVKPSSKRPMTSQERARAREQQKI